MKEKSTGKQRHVTLLHTPTLTSKAMAATMACEGECGVPRRTSRSAPWDTIALEPYSGVWAYWGRGMTEEQSAPLCFVLAFVPGFNRSSCISLMLALPERRLPTLTYHLAHQTPSVARIDPSALLRPPAHLGPALLRSASPHPRSVLRPVALAWLCCHLNLGASPPRAPCGSSVVLPRSARRDVDRAGGEIM